VIKEVSNHQKNSYVDLFSRQLDEIDF